MDLESIGFYTLSENRARTCRGSVRLSRCELIVTPRCNFKCPYCRGVDLAQDAPYAEARAVVLRWARLGLKNIRFSGGEPTLYPKLARLCSWAREGGVKRIAVSTNGSASRAVYEALLRAGVNDFSVSLDACCSASGRAMCGIPGAWERVVETIRYLSSRVYVSVGLVVTPDNLKEARDTVVFADGLGVADIRVIPAAQYGKSLDLTLPPDVLARHPILAYRAARFSIGAPVRGIAPGGCATCYLVRDDMAVMGGYHYPCIIYMRERGKPIGKVGPTMMQERAAWSDLHDCAADPICGKNCLDVCVQYNERARHYADYPAIGA